jgi:hypothetical protein
MTFGKWQQQLRLMQGVRRLAEGAKVTHAAVALAIRWPQLRAKLAALCSAKIYFRHLTDEDLKAIFAYLRTSSQ